jgi:hypothetical protein
MKSMFVFSAMLILSTAASLGSAQTPPPPAVPANPPASPTPRPAVPAVPPATSALPTATPTTPPTPKPASKDAYGNAIAPQTATPSNPAPAQSAQPVVTPFAKLDSANSGVIKPDQAAGDAWLAQHFSQCDVNRNNEVTQAEYGACSQGR